MKHDTGECEIVESGKRLSQALVVARQTAEWRSPREAAFHHPAARQQYKAAFRLGVLDYVQFNSLRVSGLCWIFPRVALIHIRQCHALIGQFLYCLGQLFNLRPVLFIGGVTCEASRCPKVSTAACTLVPLRRLARRILHAHSIPVSIAACGCPGSWRWVVPRVRTSRAATCADHAPWLQSSPPAASVASADRPPSQGGKSCGISRP